MCLEEFLHNLHFDIEKASIPDWEVDWEDKPLPYKLYRGLPVVPFSLEVPLTLEGQKQPATPDLSKMGHFLWYVYGLTQFSQSVFSLDATDHSEVMQSYRRFAPSGGALYPNELYVYLKIKDLPIGVYHYDVAHHRLVLLREGNFDSYIAKALGNRCDVSSCFGTVFVSAMFWKNFFKYNNFSYRLQGLDAGVLIGQLLEVAKRFGYESGVYFQFLDRAVNHLLGLAEREESVYAVIPLSVEPTIWSANGNEKARMVAAAELCRELTSIEPSHYVRSQRVKEYPMLTELNEMSMLEDTISFTMIGEEEIGNGGGQTVALPHAERLSYDLASVCRQRFSPDMDFIMGKISQLDLANLLYEATDSFLYRNDLESAYQKHEPRVSVNICLYNVEGIPNGAYQYDSTTHALHQVLLGDHRLLLQSGMSLYNVNLLQVPICIHVTGVKDYYKNTFGYRGYRIQQMEAGMLVQRLLLLAAASGMGGHPLLGYDSNLCDEIYKLGPQGKTSLIQIPFGPYRPRPWLMGGLYG
ncbi:SagB family peptide dehydrogenase [Bacillus sp. OK048]|uniref:SagB family peptide dehydrogenase n=1 Tax=Bacillus sp. OK048 TaxID=1882761 RepID=UPI0008810E23|nr:SagB family peptide dehydrogenase [Bacillus sp. OK048]SDN38779.1 SagB-type dehydrogenase domain-containing protein [Bacillus sp. OK048]